MRALRTVGRALLTGFNWTHRYVLSTSRPAPQVFVVDAVVTFVASYLALTAINFSLFHLGLSTAPLMVFMALVGGSIGFVGARDSKKQSMTHVRSARATIAWSIAVPVGVIVLVAWMAEALTDVSGMLIILAIIGPAVSVFGYRILGFVPNRTGRMVSDGDVAQGLTWAPDKN